ncbi:MAG: hypothetical protein NTW03_22745 [Verrucomicrobia bacterium]|nr:hypothetical protein [Verrucomicrobiota bacterium]
MTDTCRQSYVWVTLRFITFTTMPEHPTVNKSKTPAHTEPSPISHLTVTYM